MFQKNEDSKVKSSTPLEQSLSFKSAEEEQDQQGSSTTEDDDRKGIVRNNNASHESQQQENEIQQQQSSTSDTNSTAVVAAAASQSDQIISNSSSTTRTTTTRPNHEITTTTTNDSSKKAVRIMEPSAAMMESSERTSTYSLQMEETERFANDGTIRSGDDIDNINYQKDSSPGGGGGSHLNPLEENSKVNPNNNNVDSSLKRRSVFHYLTADPSKQQDGGWDKHSLQQQQSMIWKFRLICGKIVENPHVQLGIIVLIIVNAIFMGIATFDFVTDNENVEDGFSKLDRAFLSIFTVELVLQLIYRTSSYFTDAWLVFDFVIVVISWSLESLQIVRAFRIFRAFRLVTRIGPLRELVMAIGAVMPRMYAIAMLLLLIFYIFAVLFTELFREVQTEVNYFGTLDRSLFTCMELMTLEWAGITREVMSEKSWAWAPVMAFISVTGFIVFNLIVAVVCDAVAVVDREVQAEKMGEFETDTTKLEKAQERIWDLTEHVEYMLHNQKELQEILISLNTQMEEVTGESTGIIITRRQSLVS